MRMNKSKRWNNFSLSHRPVSAFGFDAADLVAP
jgi:hypothetical protein